MSTGSKESRGVRCDTQPGRRNGGSSDVLFYADGVGETHVISQNVERAVIAIRLLVHSVPKVVFRDEVARTWVEAACEEAAGDEVDERLGAKSADEEIVEDELGEDVEEMPAR